MLHGNRWFVGGTRSQGTLNQCPLVWHVLCSWVHLYNIYSRCCTGENACCVLATPSSLNRTHMYLYSICVTWLLCGMLTTFSLLVYTEVLNIIVSLSFFIISYFFLVIPYIIPPFSQCWHGFRWAIRYSLKLFLKIACHIEHDNPCSLRNEDLSIW